MATRSTIAMEQPDGRVMQIYCHWDGYLEHNGRILQEHYRDRAKVLSLMLLGDISSLRQSIGEPHDFDAVYQDDDVREQWCVAYGRDRGEKDTNAKVFRDFEDYRDNHQYEEFEYIFRLDDRWYVSQYERGYEPLEQSLESLKVAEDE
jgi:hypothetical protein